MANGAEHSEFAKWVKEFFGDTFSGSSINAEATKYYGGEERIAHNGGNSVIIGFNGSSSYTSGSSYKPEIPVLAALLGGKSSIKWSPGFSLLSKATAEFPGASVNTTNAAYSDAGLFYVSINGEAQSVARASKNVVDSLKKVAAGQISAEEIQKAKAAAKFTGLELGQTTSAGIEATGSGLISSGKPFQIDEVAKTIDKVTEAQVKSVRPFLHLPRPPPHFYPLSLYIHTNIFPKPKQAAKALLDSKATVSSVGDLFILPFADELGLKV